MKQIRVIFLFLFLMAANAALAQSEALDGAGYPNTDYFQAHTFQESWTQVYDVYQAAEDRYAGDQRALDAERDRRNRRARGNAAQKAVADWYVQECRKMDDRRGKEYAAKETAETAVKHFYDAKERHRKSASGSPSIRTAPSITDERLEQRDLPEFRSAELPIESREMPEFVNAPPSVRRKLTAWQQEQQRHDKAVKAIMRLISSELTKYLLQKDTFKDDPSVLALEKKAHHLISHRYHEQLRLENARFEAAATQLAE